MWQEELRQQRYLRDAIVKGNDGDDDGDGDGDGNGDGDDAGDQDESKAQLRKARIKIRMLTQNCENQAIEIQEKNEENEIKRCKLLQWAFQGCVGGGTVGAVGGGLCTAKKGTAVGALKGGVAGAVFGFIAGCTLGYFCPADKTKAAANKNEGCSCGTNTN